MDPTAHFLHLHPTPNPNPTRSIQIQPGLEQTGHLLPFRPATSDPDHRDCTVQLDACCALPQGGWAGDVDDEVHSATICQFFSQGSPLWGCLIVDDMIGAELAEEFDFIGRAGGCDDPGTNGSRELERKKADAAYASECQNMTASDDGG